MKKLSFTLSTGQDVISAARKLDWKTQLFTSKKFGNNGGVYIETPFATFAIRPIGKVNLVMVKKGGGAWMPHGVGAFFETMNTGKWVEPIMRPATDEEKKIAENTPPVELGPTTVKELLEQQVDALV